MNTLLRSNLNDTRKSGSGDNNNANNDATSATAFVICPTTSDTTKIY